MSNSEAHAALGSSYRVLSTTARAMSCCTVHGSPASSSSLPTLTLDEFRFGDCAMWAATTLEFGDRVVSAAWPSRNVVKVKPSFET